MNMLRSYALIVSRFIAYMCAIFRFTDGIFTAIAESFGASKLLDATHYMLLSGIVAAQLLGMIMQSPLHVPRWNVREAAIIGCNFAFAIIAALLSAYPPYMQCLFSMVIYGAVLWIGMSHRTEITREIDQENILRTEKGQQMQIAYLVRIEDNYRRTRELWHDLSNHIGAIGLLFEQNRRDELRDYLMQMRGELENIMLPARTGNIVVDAILADKFSAAKSEGIEMRLNLCPLDSLSFIQSADLCAIFANALDNAIEACLHVQDERWIAVDATAPENGISICFVNPAVTPPQLGTAGYITWKQDRDAHGWGIRSIERSVARYGGSVVSGYREGRFTLVVYFPIYAVSPI